MSLSDYSDIEKEIKDAPEPKILPSKTEARLRIISVNTGVSEKNGATWYQPVFDVPAEPLAIPFQDFFWELSDRDKLTEKQYKLALHQFRTFAEAFNIDYSRPFSWVDDLPGVEGWAILKVVKDKSGEYPDKNGIDRYVVPK